MSKNTFPFDRLPNMRKKLTPFAEYLLDNDTDLYEFDDSTALNTYFTLGSLHLGLALADKIVELNEEGYEMGTISLEMTAMGVHEMLGYYEHALDNLPIEDVIDSMGPMKVLTIYRTFTRYAQMLEKDLGISFGDKIYEDLDTLCDIALDELSPE